MSASLLNAATPPGASVGIAAQAAQAVQANSPMAGFEALLAAFFGNQGQTVAAPAGQAQPLQTLPGQPTLVGQPALPGQTASKPNAKTGANDKSDPADADKSADDTAQAATDAAADAANAALALIAPLPANPQPVAPAVTAPTSDTADATPDAGLSGKPAGSPALQFAAARAAADTPTAKDAGVVAQDTTKAAAAPLAGKPNAPVAPQAPAQPLAPPPLSDQTPATTAAALPTPTPLANAAAAVQAKAPEPIPVAKDKVLTAKAPRVDGARIEAPNVTTAAKTPVGLPPVADDAGKDAAAQDHDPAGMVAAESKPGGDDAQPDNAFNLATAPNASVNTAALTHAATLVRGSPQTVANLAAQIAKKLDGRSSRFDVQLDPAGLGKVDVRVEIDAAGKMTAAMNFDSQQAANELKSRAGELQRALEQAGFDLSGGMSFDVSGQGGRNPGQGQDPDHSPASRGRAFEAVLNGAADPAAAQVSYGRAPRTGLDIRI